MNEEFSKHILVTQAEAIADIRERIDALAATPPDEKSLIRWYEKTLDTLDHIFLSGGRSYFIKHGGFSVSYFSMDDALPKLVSANIPRANGILRRLINLILGLDFVTEPEAPNIQPSPTIAQNSNFPESNKKVFVVHGHDHESLGQVERLLEKFGLKPIIINKMANAGQTIIEKIETHSNVGFAVVLLTPDDIGASVKSQEKMEKRPRQNVLIELGYLWGKHGRARVCLLNSIGTEISSDLAGLGYTHLDERGAWKIELAKELTAAGFSIDASALIA